MAETIIDLGKKVKAKYPGQYDDLPDDEVGRRVKAKFPGAYDDFADVTAKRSLGASGSWEATEPDNPDTGIAAGVKRGVGNFNPMNVLRSVQENYAVVPAKESMKQYETALKEYSSNPVAAVANEVPFVGPALANFIRRVQSGDTEGAVTEALTTGVIGGGIGLAGRAGLRAIPKEARAAARFDQVLAKAKDVPISTTLPDAVLARAQELRQRGSQMPKVLSDYMKNRKEGKFMGQPVPAEPMTYEVGRDFASNAGALSTKEITAMNAKMQRQVAKFSQAMKDANREAAVKVGMGDVYDQAMKEYSRAKSIADKKAIIKKHAGKWALTVGLGAAGAAAFNELRD